MKKKKNGFFLAEAIVVITLVTVIMAFVYPNIVKISSSNNKKVNSYNQIEDIYALELFYDYLNLNNDDDGNTKLVNVTNNGCNPINEFKEILNDNNNFKVNYNALTNYKIEYVFITDYLSSTSYSNSNTNTSITLPYRDFNKYLRSIPKETYASGDYRIIGVFKKEDTNDLRYASIRIANPNPDKKNCNISGGIDNEE